WLRALTGLDWSVEEMADRLTLCGTACEEIDFMGQYLDKVVVGEVTDVQPIAGADKIRKASVTTGSGALDLVCGAPNVAVGQKVAVALEGAELAGGIKIKKAKIRGVESRGMICAEDELGLSEDHTGILVLAAEAVPGTPLIEHLELDDYIMGFELTPNRADSMSAVGIARDLAALASSKVKYPHVEVKTTSEKASDVIRVTIDDAEACPRFTARIIRNIKIGPSPWWMQEKLIACGMRPISNVVDVSNYVMLETGHPVHAFDLDRFGSREVLVRRATEGEELVTLDGEEHKLTPEVLLITNGKEAKAAAGIMGGSDSEVDDDTRNILLEVACFNPRVIRRSRKQMGMDSEASTRFEKGVDPNDLPEASARVCQLFAELCGGEVSEGIVDCYPHKIEPLTVELRPKRCNDIMGVEVPTERMIQVFKDLEFAVSGDDPIKVTVPTFRPDISREIDLIEEVARIEGYESIPDSTDNIGSLYTPDHKGDRFEDEVRTVLTGAGFDEIMGHGLSDSRLAELLNPGLPQIKIISPVSEDLDIMRNDLAQTTLTSIGHNLSHRNLDLRFFEIGKAYFPADTNGDWIEEDRLLLAVTGQTSANWREKPRALDFYDLSGALNRLTRHFHWSRFEFDPAEVNYLQADLSFSLKFNGDVVGSIGQVAPGIAKKADVKQPVYLAQLKMAPLFAESGELAEFKSLPVYPAAPRDLALVVDESVRVGQIVDLIEDMAGELAESTTIFDLYAGKQITKGKKSVGVAITYRSTERSLSSEEVDQMQSKIVAALRKKFNAEVRDK
ncbi:MAG: phenylalanine--tRNA ligase subunit beta, partial [bacterium]|nr:phenylalanine--tRNA ligase subunit beta [bacterium]